MEITRTNVHPRLSFFSIGKHLNFICKLGEHDSKLSEEMCEHSNNKSGGGCVALLKFKFTFFFYTGPDEAGRSVLLWLDISGYQ